VPVLGAIASLPKEEKYHYDHRELGEIVYETE